MRTPCTAHVPTTSNICRNTIPSSTSPTSLTSNASGQHAQRHGPSSPCRYRGVLGLSSSASTASVARRSDWATSALAGLSALGLLVGLVQGMHESGVVESVMLAVLVGLVGLPRSAREPN